MNLAGPVWGCRRLCISYIYMEETKERRRTQSDIFSNIFYLWR